MQTQQLLSRSIEAVGFVYQLVNGNGCLIKRQWNSPNVQLDFLSVAITLKPSEERDIGIQPSQPVVAAAKNNFLANQIIESEQACLIMHQFQVLWDLLRSGRDLLMKDFSSVKRLKFLNLSKKKEAWKTKRQSNQR